MRVLRLPAPHALRLIDSPAGSVGACRQSDRFRVRQSDPGGKQASRRARSLGHPDLHFRNLPPRANAGSPIFCGVLSPPSQLEIDRNPHNSNNSDAWQSHPMTSRRSRDPGRPVAPRRDGASGAAPGNATARAPDRGADPHHWNFRGSIAALCHLLSTLHDPRCRWPCKTRFRLAGCAFAGRSFLSWRKCVQQ